MKSLKKKQIWSSFAMGLDSICSHGMEMDDFLYLGVDLVIFYKNINYMPIILTLGKNTYSNLK